MSNADRIVGVNLGNWLVLEKWMNPRLFAGTDAEDEYHLARALAPERYEERMRAHRDTYITERDFALLAHLGVNAVRIPVPFFLFGDRAPYLGCLEWLDAAFDWAERWELKILIDLHTVPGSQNGFDNGGLCGVCRWSGLPREVSFVLDLLEKIAQRYGRRRALWGIQPLNEPITTALLGDRPWEESGILHRYPAADLELVKGSAPISIDFLQDFYTKAYHRLRLHLPVDKAVVFHDAFCLPLWKDFLQRSDFRNVVMDTHMYLSSLEMLGCEQSPAGYAQAIQTHFSAQLQEMSSCCPVICGEWCLDSAYTRALPDGPLRNEGYRQLAQLQLEAWQQCAGSFYWNYKLLNPGEHLACWDFLSSLCRGWLPSPTEAGQLDDLPRAAGC